jgi:hypothetical protein
MVMDKPPQPPSSFNSTSSSYLKPLNKSSYKISKQSSTASSMRAASPPPPPPPRPSPPPPPPPPSSVPADPPPPQPPVYNIDKSDFRDVVQKLTGSPSHLLPQQPAAAGAQKLTGSPSHLLPQQPAAAGAPPPPPRPIMPPPPPPTAIPSRLHRIRPPPLAAPRPAPILAPALSPLPPLPAVCMSAESPISAYMRRLRGMPSPINVPTSPLGFGCLPSPRTPPSPGVPMPATSPRVRDP